MPNHENVSAHYLDEAGQRYAAHHQSSTDHAGFALDLAHFAPYLTPSDVVLDFGCGNGGMLRLIRERVARADGLEVNPTAAEMAEAEGSTIYRRPGDLPDRPTYDVVLSNHVLEHVRDPSSTLERLRRCIKPGGLFVTKLPIDDFREGLQRRWSRDDINHHLHTWTPRLFANTLYEAGYDVRSCRVITSAWHPKLFPLIKLGVAPLAFWALAVVQKRRQLFAVATPAEGTTPPR